jgi:HlyD family secretion protein
LRDDIAAEQAALQRAHSDLAATRELQRKLEQTLPSLQAEEKNFNALVEEGCVEKTGGCEKQRARIENEQDLRAQEFNAKSLQAAIAQSQRRISQIKSSYRQKLEADRVAIYAEHQKLEQEWAKQSHKNSLLELRAPQAGTIKDLATHTTGTVVSPGTVLMSLVPSNEALQAEVWLENKDAGFVRKGQEVKVKLMAYPFQKYGMIDGEVIQVSADATDRPQQQGQNEEKQTQPMQPSSYKTIVKLQKQFLAFEGDRLELTPGMQVAAEIKLADQTVMQYLLSPVRKGFHDAARER